MEIRIWDAEGTTTRIMRSYADSNQYPIKHHSDFESLSSLRFSCNLTIVDSSVLPAGSTSMLHLLKKEQPLAAVYVAETIQVLEAVELMRAGAIAVCEHAKLDNWLSNTMTQLVEEATQLNLAYEEFSALNQDYGSLSIRESEVLEQVVAGIPNKEIAETLSISIRTVEARRAKLYKKMAVSGLAQLIFKIASLEQLGRLFQDDSDGLQSSSVPRPNLLRMHKTNGKRLTSISGRA